MAKLAYPHADRTIDFGGLDGIARATMLELAMESDKTVRFMYDDKIRVVEVHAIGTSTKDGSLLMRGFQVAGAASRPLPSWSLFTVSKIDSLSFGTTPSEAPREGYAQSDSQMDSIVAEIAL